MYNFMVPKMFEARKFDCTYVNEGSPEHCRILEFSQIALHINKITTPDFLAPIGSPNTMASLGLFLVSLINFIETEGQVW